MGGGPFVPEGAEPCKTLVQSMIERSLAQALRAQARKNCRTVSGEIRALLQREFAGGATE
jgi:hypothetical protein